MSTAFQGLRVIDPDTPAMRRTIAAGAVIALHVALLLALAATGTMRPVLRTVLPATLIPAELPPPPRPPAIPSPTLSAPPDLVPLPEIALAPPPAQPAAPKAITRATRAPPSGGHFGAASEAGLGLDVAASTGGGAGARGTLAGFEAEVRRKVLAGKRQPVLAADRRNTCVVNYSVRVGAGGRLAGFSIDPCAIPEINEAARTAIRTALLPAPPDLGAPSYEVHGSLIFRP